MKILVMSDSHGSEENMLRAVEQSSPNLIIHLGDCVRDTECLEQSYPSIPLWRVRGNCDFDFVTPESGLEEVDGVRIFFAHGHRHGVKMNMDSFCNSVCFSGAKLGLFGHTHRAVWHQIAGIEILNPGSIGDHRNPTYAIIETTGTGAFSCRLCKLEENI
ncbi:MAG: YfcE family phosphodiesterase [Oscillospiraceae bacterium]|nr:YfcE family phosphodiesterase [Oscillospiraceae bacterium]